MKKLFKNFLMLTAVGAIAFLYSCSEEDEPTAAAPSLTVSVVDSDANEIASGSEIVAPATITVTLNGTAPGGFDSFILSANGTEQARVTRTDLQLDAGTTSATFTTNVSVADEEIGTTIDWTFTIVDGVGTGQTGEVTFSYSVVAPPSPDANTGMNILFGQLNDGGGSFYDLRTDAVYGYSATRDEQTANVDFAFFYGSESGYAIAALRDESLQTAFESAGVPIDGIFNANDFNFTSFKAIEASADDFDAVDTEADIANLIGEVAPDASVANNLAVGSVFAFLLDEEKREGLSGLMKITETGGDSGASRTISFEVKYTSPVQ